MDMREHVIALNTKRAKINKEQQDLIDKRITENPGEPFSAEDRATIAKMDADIDAISAEVKAFVDREEREDSDSKLREAHASVFGSERVLERQEQTFEQRFEKWARGEARGDEGKDFEGKTNTLSVDLRPAHRIMNRLRDGASHEEVRALLWDTGSIASGVPVTTANTVYQLMTAGIAAFRMPTTKITTDGGETMYFPKIAAHGIGTQVIAQGTAIGGTDPTFARMQLDAFKYGQLVQVASETISDEGFNVLDFVAGNVARAVAQVADADLIVGTGSGEPQGMMSAVTVGNAGTVATGGTLITPTFENLVDLVYSVNDQYRQSSACAFLMRDATAGIIRKIRDGAGGTIGQPLWQVSPYMGLRTGEPDTVLGYPVYIDPNVASCASNARIVTFGDWNAYYTRLVGSFVFERSDDYAFNVDEVTFRGKQRLDGDFIDLTAVNLLKQSV
jgi:HK97 family phage major capsid protein